MAARYEKPPLTTHGAYVAEDHDGRPMVGDFDDPLLVMLQDVHCSPPGTVGYRSEKPKLVKGEAPPTA